MSAAMLLLALLGPTERPAVVAVVVMHHGRLPAFTAHLTDLDSHQTYVADEAGAIKIGNLPERAVIWGPTGSPRLVTMSPDTLELSLDEGDLLCGRLLFADGTPLQGTRVVLAFAAVPAVEGIPEKTWRRITNGRTNPTCVTDSSGEFIFSGLPSGWSGAVFLPWYLGATSISVSCEENGSGRNDIYVRTVARVELDWGTLSDRPANGGSQAYVLHGDDGAVGRICSGADECLYLSSGELPRAGLGGTLYVLDENKGCIDIRRVEVVQRMNIAILIRDRSHTAPRHVEVVDEREARLPGALLWSDKYSWSRVRASSDGRAAIWFLDVVKEEQWAVRYGHEPKRFSSTEQQVLLKRAPTLSARVEAHQGLRARFTVVGSDPVYPANMPFAIVDELSLGQVAGSGGVSFDSPLHTASFSWVDIEPTESGLAGITAVDRAMDVTLQVVDSCGCILGRSLAVEDGRRLRLTRSDYREGALELASTGKKVVVFVRDAEGNPVSEASALVSCLNGPDGMRAEKQVAVSSINGSIVLPLFDPTASVEIGKEGYISTQVSAELLRQARDHGIVITLESAPAEKAGRK